MAVKINAKETCADLMCRIYCRGSSLLSQRVWVVIGCFIFALEGSYLPDDGLIFCSTVLNAESKVDEKPRQG